MWDAASGLDASTPEAKAYEFQSHGVVDMLNGNRVPFTLPVLLGVKSDVLACLNAKPKCHR